jgi:hypothetical protein
VLLQSVADGKVAPRLFNLDSTRMETANVLPHIPGGRVPEELAAVIRKAMAVRREERYASVKDLQAALHTANHALFPSKLTTSPQSAPASRQARGKAGALVIALVIAVVLLGALCVKFAIDRSRAEAALRDSRNRSGTDQKP